MVPKGFRSLAGGRNDSKFSYVFDYVKKCDKIPQEDRIPFSIYLTDRILNGDFPRRILKLMNQKSVFLITNNASGWEVFFHSNSHIYKFYKTVKRSTLDKYNAMFTKWTLWRILS